MRTHDWAMIRVSATTAQRLRGVSSYLTSQARKKSARVGAGRRKLFGYDLTIKHLLDCYCDLSGKVSR